MTELLEYNYKRHKEEDASKLWKLKSFENEIVTFEYKEKIFEVSGTDVNFIHDFAFNELGEKTDKLILGLTPDYYDDESIIELGTTTSYNEEAMKDMFNLKFEKYMNLSRVTERKLIIIIMGPNLSLCNILDYEELDSMNERFRVALSIREVICEDFNRHYWYYSDESKLSRILKSILMNPYIVKPKDDFENSLNKKLKKPSIKEIQNYLELCASRMSEFQSKVKEFKDRTLDYELSGTRIDMKRVIPVSLIVPSRNLIEIQDRIVLQNLPSLKDMGDPRFKIINKARKSIEFVHDKEKEKNIAHELEEAPKFKIKTMYKFFLHFNAKDREELAKSGVQAKEFLDLTSVCQKRLKDKEPFSINVNTDDIEEFINTRTLDDDSSYFDDFAITAFENWSLEYNFNYKNIFADYTSKSLITDYKNIVKTKVIGYTDFLQSLFGEINLSIRENLNRDFFTVKPIPGYEADVYIKCTGSMKPIFFFITGKINYTLGNMSVGVKYDIIEDYFVTHWSSIKLRDIERYLSINTTMISTIAYLKQLEFQSEVLQNHVNYILLLALSNKDRDEEINTLLRYIYMRSLSLTDNVTDLIVKLPKFARSRLNVYQIKCELKLMKRLYLNKPLVTKTQTGKDRDVSGLFDIFGNFINFKQALNFSYYGYIVNKQKQMEDNQASKLIDKILEFDCMIDDGKMLSGVEVNELRDHLHNESALSVVCELAKHKLTNDYGMNYQSNFWSRLVNKLNDSDLYSLATIKASAKMDTDENVNDNTLRKLNTRKPRVVESLKELDKLYGKRFEHPIEMVNFCLREIDVKDCFNVELFSKDQHAGIREIYVIDIRVRVLQWFLETISRVLCSYFESETMTHPSMKDQTAQRLTRSAINDINKPIVLCRSGDASKWSQTQNVTKFYQCLTYFLPIEFHEIIKSILTLWYRKKIWLPPSLINFCLTSSAKLDNKSVNFMREIYLGKQKDYRLDANKPFLRIRTGFMQGILHFTSSFFHTVVQEGFAVIKDLLVKIKYPLHEEKKRLFHNIILQGSDDNSETIILDKETYKTHTSFFNMLVQLKDIMSDTVGIKVSIEKTASCVPFLMEYNSMWELAGKFIMPTVKFVFVATEIPNKQSMIGRQEYYYSLLTNCIEKGSTIRTANVIRLAQCKQHYLQLGLYHNSLFHFYYSSLLESKNPSLGYFMFEPIICSGLIGFDFMLYWHCMYTNYKHYLDLDETIIPIGVLDKRGYRSVADYSIAKLQFKKWSDIYKSLGLGSVELSRENINKQPEILYGKIHDSMLEWDLINLKMTDFSIKESLSSRFNKSEMFASSIYILSRQVCYANNEKHSLIYLIRNQLKKKDQSEDIRKAFPRSTQYDSLIKELSILMSVNMLINAEYVQRGSSKIKILDGINEESYKLLDLCRCKWFDLKTLPLSKNLINKYFNQAKTNLSWLRDTESETKEILKCDSFELYTYLLNTFKDSRNILLLDTAGKKGTLTYLISRILDINKKLIYRPISNVILDKRNEASLKSNLKFLISFPFTFDIKIQNLKRLIPSFVDLNLRKDEMFKFKMLDHAIKGQWDEVKMFMFDHREDLELTIFTKRQRFDTEKREWKGPGIVLCQRGYLIFELLLNNNECIKVSVNQDDMKKIDFKKIVNCARELNFEFTKHEGDVRHRINKSGISLDKIGTEVIFNKNLSFNIDNIDNLDVDISHDRIRLISRMKPKDLTDFSLMDELGRIHEVLIERKGQYLWIPSTELRSDEKIKRHRLTNQSNLTKTLTIMSLNTRKYMIDHSSEVFIEPMTEFSELFWSGICDVKKLTQIVSDLTYRLDAVDIYSKFCEENNLDENCYKIFQSAAYYRKIDFDDRKEIAEERMEIMEHDFVPGYFMDLMSEFKEVDISILHDMNKIDFDMSAMVMESMENFAEFVFEMNDEFYRSLGKSDYLLDPIVKNFDMMINNKYKKRLNLVLNDNNILKLLDKRELSVILALFNINVTREISDIWNDLWSESKKSRISDDKNERQKVDEEIDMDLVEGEIENNNLNRMKLLCKILQIEFNTNYDEMKQTVDDGLIEIENSIEDARNSLTKYKIPSVRRGNQVRLDDLNNSKEIIIELLNLLKIEIDNLELINLEKLDMKEVEVHNDENDIIILSEPIVELIVPFMDVEESYNEELLRMQLNLDDFEMFNILGDGNCLFSALLVSSLIYGTFVVNCFADDIREQISDNHLDYSILKDEEELKHVEDIKNPNVWGCNYCAHTFGKMTSNNIIIRCPNKCLLNMGERSLAYKYFLDYVNNNHFNCLIPKNKIKDFVENFEEEIDNFEVLNSHLYRSQLNNLKEIYEVVFKSD